MTTPAPRSRLLERLFEPVDAASLAVFRVCMGLLGVWEVVKFWHRGWLRDYYIGADFHFTYHGFTWVAPWPGDGMYWHCAALAIVSMMVTLGVAYRIAAPLFVLGFAHLFLIDQAYYLNHIYLFLLLGFALCIVPAHRAYALGARRGRGPSPVVPAWTVWALRAQMEVVLIYAGIVKLNADWLSLRPMTIWLGMHADVPLVGPLLGEPWVVAFGSYAPIALHLVGAPLLLWHRTRGWVFSIYVCFHLLNAALFDIGIFPWLTIAGTALFFEPDWPRRLGARCRGWLARAPGLAAHGAARTQPTLTRSSKRNAATVAVLLFAWFAVNLLVPLRHLLYEGDVAWTREGYRFAWQMMLNDTRATAEFLITDPAIERSWRVDPTDQLGPQLAGRMAAQPDMILQYAHYLASQWERRGFRDVEVRAEVFKSLNGRPWQRFVDSSVNLAARERRLGHAEWIMSRPPVDDGWREGARP